MCIILRLLFGFQSSYIILAYCTDWLTDWLIGCYCKLVSSADLVSVYGTRTHVWNSDGWLFDWLTGCSLFQAQNCFCNLACWLTGCLWLTVTDWLIDRLGDGLKILCGVLCKYLLLSFWGVCSSSIVLSRYLSQRCEAEVAEHVLMSFRALDGNHIFHSACFNHPLFH